MIDFACKSFNLQEIVKCSLGLTKADMKVLNFMLGNDKAFTTEDIAKRIGLNLSTVQRAVKKLYEKEVLFRTQENLSGGGYVFVYHIKNRDVVRRKIISIVDAWSKKVESAIKNW